MMRKLRHDRVEMALVGPLANSVYQGGSRHICSLSWLDLILGDLTLVDETFGITSSKQVKGVSGQPPDYHYFYFVSPRERPAQRCGPSHIRHLPTAQSATRLRSAALELPATPVHRPPIDCP
jgi:hypothetical protein